jgi:dipeptidyl aminopeptidase/acylaminoacyl peptidase
MLDCDWSSDVCSSDLTHAPELYLAAIASAPPTDLGRALDDAASASGAWQESGFSLRATLAALGIRVDDAALRARLTRESPAGAADHLRRPVVLFAGATDDRVSLRSVIHYAALLAALGKDVSLFVDPDAGHTLDGELLREALFYVTERALHRLIGTPAPAPPSLPLHDLVQSRLRLVGATLAPR